MALKLVKLLPWKMSSEGARAIARALGIPRLRHDGSSLKGRPAVKIINWGSSSPITDEFDKCTWINKPSDVAVASNKLSFFEAYEGFQGFVPWTKDRDTVRNWLGDGHVVFARTILNGHSGAGISVMHPDNPDTWVEARLYTKYTKKKDEFRVHFMGGEIIDIQKKATRADANPEAINYKIRNHANGFVFIRGFDGLPPAVQTVCQNFIEITPLFFGAIDVMYNERQNSAYILEVNTAPGLTGTTVEKYKEAFERHLG